MLFTFGSESTEEQKRTGISVDNQIDELRKWVKDNGYIEAGLYNDAGISARKTYKKRPALLQMISDCQAGKIDLVVFTRLDRFFRSVADYYACVEQMNDVPWKAIWEDYETETSSGKFKVNIMLSVAQSEADKTSERIKNTFAYKLSKGEYCGGNKAAWGYKRNGTKYVFDEEMKPYVDLLFNTYLNTFSRKTTLEAVRNAGYRLTNDKFYNCLKSEVYYAGISYVQDAYITEEQHELIRKSIKSGKKNPNRFYIFSGMLKCGCCGRSLVGRHNVITGKGGIKVDYLTYKCKYEFCTQSSIGEPVLERIMLDRLETELNDYNIKIEKMNVNENEKIKTNIQNRLGRLRDLYEMGDIDKNEYILKKEKLNDELRSIKTLPEKKEELPYNWKEMYNELDREHKRAFWMRTLSKIEIGCRKCRNPIIYF